MNRNKRIDWTTWLLLICGSYLGIRIIGGFLQ